MRMIQVSHRRFLHLHPRPRPPRPGYLKVRKDKVLLRIEIVARLLAFLYILVE